MGTRALAQATGAGRAERVLEEFRAVIADRLVISLINLKQVQPDGFETQPTGAVLMSSATRRVVLAVLVQRKKEELTHPLLDAKVPIGLLPLLQARLLARHLRESCRLIRRLSRSDLNLWRRRAILQQIKSELL